MLSSSFGSWGEFRIGGEGGAQSHLIMVTSALWMGTDGTLRPAHAHHDSPFCASSQLHTQWLHTHSWKFALMGAFTPQKATGVPKGLPPCTPFPPACPPFLSLFIYLFEKTLRPPRH